MSDEATPEGPATTAEAGGAGTAGVTLERSPVDVLRAVIAAGLLVALLVTGWLFGNSVVAFIGDLVRGLDAIPRWLATTVVVGFRVVGFAALVAGTIVAIAQRRLRLLGTVALAVLLAVGLTTLVEPLERVDPEQALDVHDDVLGPISEEEFPAAEGVALIAAVATASAPWTHRRWRRLAWGLVVAAAASRFLTAPVSFDTVYALVIGWLSGSVVLLALGSPVRRPTREAVMDGLRLVGVDLATLERAGVDARGSTPYFGETSDGTKLFVKALGDDERSADLLFRAWRKVLPHDLGDEKAFSSLRRTVEHEALVALAARDLGVQTPRLAAFATAEPNAYVLAYEAIAGKSLDGVDAEQLTDEVLRAVWSAVAHLRRHRVAHRDLRLANVFLAADGEVWMIDFGFSELAASDLLLANDLAELLASLTLAVGLERALAAGLDTLPPAELATAAARLRPFALSGATRTGMKAHDGLLDELRGRVEALAPAA